MECAHYKWIPYNSKRKRTQPNSYEDKRRISTMEFKDFFDGIICNVSLLIIQGDEFCKTRVLWETNVEQEKSNLQI